MRKRIASARVPSVCLLIFSALLTATCSLHDEKPIVVSVRDVVIDPYAVDGKLVNLVGLLHRGPKGDALYWHQQDIEQSNHSHAVSVQLPSWPDGAGRRGTYVAVEGIFEADHDQRGSTFNGALLDARRVQVR